MSDARRYSGLGKDKLKELVAFGKIIGRKLQPGKHGHWRFDRESIDAYFSDDHHQDLAFLESIGL